MIILVEGPAPSAEVAFASTTCTNRIPHVAPLPLLRPVIISAPMTASVTYESTGLQVHSLQTNDYVQLRNHLTNSLDLASQGSPNGMIPTGHQTGEILAECPVKSMGLSLHYHMSKMTA